MIKMKEKLTALFIGILYDHLKHESGEFSDQDWLQHNYHGTSNMSLQYCVNSQKSFWYIRAIQGHTGGEFDSA